MFSFLFFRICLTHVTKLEEKENFSRHMHMLKNGFRTHWGFSSGAPVIVISLVRKRNKHLISSVSFLILRIKKPMCFLIKLDSISKNANVRNGIFTRSN